MGSWEGVEEDFFNIIFCSELYFVNTYSKKQKQKQKVWFEKESLWLKQMKLQNNWAIPVLITCSNEIIRKINVYIKDAKTMCMSNIFTWKGQLK